MDAKTVLLQLELGGVRLKIENRRLKIKGNPTEKHKKLIKEYKNEITALLINEEIIIAEYDNEIDRILATKGYALIYSRILDEEIIFAETELIKELLSEVTDLVIYTMDELTILCAESCLDHDNLKRIHEEKKLCRGTIVEGLNLEVKKSP